MLITTIPMQTFLLSQIFGLYMLTMAMILFIRADYYRPLIKKIKAPGIGIMLHASLGLLISLFLVLINNDWALEPRVFVTLLCWIFLIKSIAWLAAPVHMLKLAKRVCSGKGYYAVITIMMVIAIQMMMRAFYLYMHHGGVLPAAS